MLAASRMRRRQRNFTFIFFASLFKAGNLPVLKLDDKLQFPPIPILFVQSVGGKGVLKARKARLQIHSLKTTQLAKKSFFIRQVLGAGAMVTYLKLHLDSVEQLIELVDVVAVPLAERLHDLAQIIVGVGGAEPTRTTPPANQGIISRSFNLVGW